MATEMEMPESFDTGGAFLQEPGTYHLAVMEVDEHPTTKKGELLDGFRVDVVVLAGPHDKKQADLMFFAPKLTDKNGGEMAKKKQARFAIATGVIQAAKPGEKVTVDMQLAKGRQFIATLAHRESQNDASKKFIDLNFADIWHVDDPAAPQCERSQQALKLLPESLRRKAESFAKQNGSAAEIANRNTTTNKTPANQPAGAGAGATATAAVGVDMNNI